MDGKFGPKEDWRRSERYPTVLESLWAVAEKKIQERLEAVIASHMMPRYRLYKKQSGLVSAPKYGEQFLCMHCGDNWWRKGTEAFAFWDVVLYHCAECGNTAVMHYPIMVDEVEVVRSVRYSPQRDDCVPDAYDRKMFVVNPEYAYGV